MNPYAPLSSLPETSTDAALSELVRAWEKLRLLYNLLLFFPGLGVLTLWHLRVAMPLSAGIPLSILFGIGANCAFFLGPASELYIRALFRQGQTIGHGRKLIFGAGILVSFGIISFAAVIALLQSPS